ncbi:hypothetical protein V7127_20970 [Bacillus sp. JJ1773]|uniref:hypothetical protein n=1 Tax=Bacillus sp. JJ1773 TaxID=3122965 RepID=UPI002FFF7E72
MQVNNLFNGTPLQLNEGSSPLRAGEVVQAVIKDRLDHNQATVIIKGQELTVKFEGNIPANDRLNVSVVGFDNKGQAIVKAVTVPISQSSINEMVKMGLDPAAHSELRDAIQYLTKKGYQLTKDDISNLQQFIEKGTGSYKDNFTVIQALAQRKLEITSTHLSAIYDALHGEPASSVLFDFLQGTAEAETDQTDTITPKLEKQILQALEVQLEVQVEESEGSAPNVTNAKPELTADEYAKRTEEPAHLSESSTQDQPIPDDAVQPLNLDSKNILVTEITKKLSQMTIDFNSMKREAVKYLDHLNQFLNENKPIPAAQVKQLLESTINKLDNAILKGNYMLYTDMGTEKELLSASSQLAKARDMLAKGSYLEANEIVKEVKVLLNNISFKPSISKVMHFVSEQSLLQKEEPTKQILKELQQAIKPISGQESSARQVFEVVKRLGLIHENQAAHLVTGTSKGETEPNLKSALMKLIQAEDGQPRTVQPLEQALNNLTGQQLLNKPDSTGVQNLFMQLPLLLHNKVENVKVFVNSQKKGEGIDWENCSLYFVLETQKLGNIGILVHANNRNLSITLKTNREGLAEKAGQFSEASLQRLNEIGYKVGSVQIKPFDGQETNQTPMEAKTASEEQTSTERGYDFKI